MKQEKSSLISSLLQEKPWYQSREKSILSFILAITADLFQHSPSWIKKPFTRWIDELGLFLIRILKIIPLSNQPYYYIQSGNKDNKEPTILYKGDLSSFMVFLKRIYPNKEDLFITTIEKDNKKVKKLIKQVDMFILEKDLFYKGYFKKRNFLILPENISFILPMQHSVEKMIGQCSQGIQHDIEKAKSFGYQCRVSDTMTDFSMFYNTMYLPYTKWKHKGSEKIISYHAMKHYYLRGAKILLVTLDDEPVFGGIFEIRKNEIITHYAGVKEGNYNHIHNGIMSLSYYFLLKIAKENHVHSINFGTSPPFILDGLCAYKMKWNMEIKKTKPIFSTIFAVTINNKSEKILNIFKENSFFYYKNDELSVACFVNDPTNIIKHNHLKGIEPTFFHSLEELYTN